MPGHEALRRRVLDRLRALEDAGLIRTLRAPTGVDCCSNDYLALSRHPAVASAMAAAATQHGCGSTGSRLLRGHRAVFDRIERRFAAFKRTEQAIYFSSGYLANLAVLTTFPERHDLVVSDARNHASLIDGIRLSAADRVIARHNDVAHLREILEGFAGRSGRAFVVVESIFSMDGDLAPLRDIAALCRAASAALVVDEAHAIGIYGERGSGFIEESGVSDDVFVSINTGGKALGVAGAFVAGPAWAIEYLVQRGRPFVFTTAPPPPMAAALDASLDVIAQEPERRARLRALARYARDRFIGAGIPLPPTTSHIIPVIVGGEDRAMHVADALQTDGFDVRAIRPPTVPAGTARLRVSINVEMTQDVLDRLAGQLASALKRTPACAAVSS